MSIRGDVRRVRAGVQTAKRRVLAVLDGHIRQRTAQTPPEPSQAAPSPVDGRGLEGDA